MRHKSRKNKPQRKRKAVNAMAVPIANLPKRTADSRDRSMHAVAWKRRNPKKSMTYAASLHGVKVSTIRKHFPSALKKVKGRLQVAEKDRYSATLYVPDSNGNPIPVHTRSSKDRKALSRYLHDVGRYLGGERNALAPWRGKTIAGVELVTSANVIVLLEPALSDFSLYRATNSRA